MGKKKKPDIGAQYRDYPNYQQAPGSSQAYETGLQGLIDTFTRRSLGEDQFDYLKYLFEPQETYLRKQYGIDVPATDVYANQAGILPQTLASLNRRGLLDSGTSGIIESQVRTNLADKLGELFGTAKQLQRQDIDRSLEALNQLYPQRYEVQNIPYQIDFFNNVNDYNVAAQREAAQQAYNLSQGPKTLFGQALPILGSAATTGLLSAAGPVGTAIGTQLAPKIGNLFGSRVSSTTPGFNSYFDPARYYAGLFG